MPLDFSIPLFLGSLRLVVGGSVLLSRDMGKLGEHWTIPERFLGFLIARGADSPEISSAVVSMLSDQTQTGVGLVFGSNLFNLAALLGLSTAIARRIRVRRELLFMTTGVVAVLAFSQGLSRNQGAAIIAAYLVFVAVRVCFTF
jgi:cation:H+ antiporter